MIVFQVIAFLLFAAIWSSVGLLIWIQILIRTAFLFTGAMFIKAVAHTEKKDQTAAHELIASSFWFNGFRYASDSIFETETDQSPAPQEKEHDEVSFSRFFRFLKEVALTLVFSFSVVALYGGYYQRIIDYVKGTNTQNVSTTITEDNLTPFANFNKSFTGHINSQMAHVLLNNNYGVLSGYYYYDSKGDAQKLDLNGTVESNGKFELKEIYKGSETGIFRGNISKHDNKYSLTGKWSKPDNTAEVDFLFVE